MTRHSGVNPCDGAPGSSTTKSMYGASSRATSRDGTETPIAIVAGAAARVAVRSVLSAKTAAAPGVSSSLKRTVWSCALTAAPIDDAGMPSMSRPGRPPRVAIVAIASAASPSAPARTRTSTSTPSRRSGNTAAPGAVITGRRQVAQGAGCARPGADAASSAATPAANWSGSRKRAYNGRLVMTIWPIPGVTRARFA